MARLYDSNGFLLGGLNAHRVGLPHGARPGAVPRVTGSTSTASSASFRADEIVPGLECSYGTFAYSYSNLPLNNVSGRSAHAGCHNPVETPIERFHCDACGGDYCLLHLDPAAHDCRHIQRS